MNKTVKLFFYHFVGSIKFWFINCLFFVKYFPVVVLLYIAMAILNVFLAFQFLIHLSFAQTKFCEKSCPIHEVFSKNVSQCHNTCFNQNFNQTAKCSIALGCVCSQGYTRHQETYKCVPLKICDIKKSSKTCPNNEIYSECNAGCQKTCKTRNQQFKCSCVSGCVCKSGFIRSDVNFQCIPEKLCSSM